jgi:D-serine deaminase-like pyridoxal phosphate-dependent protein
MRQVEAPDTPALVVDEDAVERNLARWQAFCDDHGIACRPHVKTHRCAELARRQVALGAVGVTCQKLGEAEAMVAGGIEDVLIPYNIVGPAKLARLAALTRVARVTVSADDPRVVDGLATTGADVNVLVDCDTGFGRTGVQTPAAAADLAGMIAGSATLRFGGFLTHPAAPGCTDFLAAAQGTAAARGVQADTVSVGGAAMMWRADSLLPVVTEYRAGTYVFLDRRSVDAGIGSRNDIALTVAATVVSRPTRTRAIIDAGLKSLTGESGPAGLLGELLDHPGAGVYGLDEEHGYVNVPEGAELEIGQPVRVVPNHVCATVNLFDRMHVTRGGVHVDTWTVDARGRSA